MKIEGPERYQTRLLIIHNRIMHYRLPIFLEISRITPTRILLTKDAEEEIPIAGLDVVNLRSGIGASRQIFVLIRLFRELMKDQYQVVIGGNWDDMIQLASSLIAVTLAKIRNNRFVLWTESWNYDRKLISGKRKLADPIIRYLVKCSDSFIVPGIKSKELLLHLNAPEMRIVIAPNWSSPCILSEPEPPESKMRLERGSDIRFIFLARIDPIKGLDILLRAFAMVEKSFPNARLIIGGDGPDRLRMIRLSNILGIRNVEFRGWIALDKRESVLAESDILVLPSRYLNGLSEAWGLVLNEAMASGKPVISTFAAGGAYDLIIEGETGFIVEPENVESLREAMERFCKEPERIARMGEKAKQMIERDFSLEKMVSGILAAVDIAARQE